MLDFLYSIVNMIHNRVNDFRSVEQLLQSFNAEMKFQVCQENLAKKLPLMF